MSYRLSAYDRWVGNGCERMMAERGKGEGPDGTARYATIVDLGHLFDEAGEAVEGVAEAGKRLRSLVGSRNISAIPYGQVRVVVYIPPTKLEEVLEHCPAIKPATLGGHLGGYGGWCTHVWGAE